MTKAILNGKFLMQHQTGVQRFAHGLLPYLNDIQVLKPTSDRRRDQIIWEQLTLGKLAKKEDKLLLNLCNTAPFWYQNQMVCMHDMAVFENPLWFNKSFAQYYQLLFKRLAKTAKHFITVSEFSKQEMMKYLGLKDHQIAIIHSAPSEHLIKAKAKKPALNVNKPFLLMVGSHDPRKNFNWVIQHLNNWLLKNNYELLIIGNPGEAFHKENKAFSQATKWLSSINDAQLKWLYQNAELVIHPALYEGFSLVPIEAMRLGTKVLISDIPVHREIAGASTYYFNLNKPEELELQVDQALKSIKPDFQNTYSFKMSGDKLNHLINLYQ